MAKPDTGPAADRVVREIGLLFRRARSYAKGAARDVHPELQPPTYSILAQLVENGPARARDLAELFGIDKAAISRQVGMLETLGLVRREPDPDDGRAQLLSPTEDGAARFRAAVGGRRALLRAELETWDDADVDAFATLLARFNAVRLPD